MIITIMPALSALLYGTWTLDVRVQYKNLKMTELHTVITKNSQDVLQE